MAIEPDIEVTEKTTSQPTTNTRSRSSIAVIGAFDSKRTEVTVCKNATEAHALFGTTDTPDAFKGTDAIDHLFTGASELIIVNTTTWDGDTPTTTISNQQLSDALTQIKDESFGMLFIAEELTDEAQTLVSTWLANEARAKFPHGQIAQCQKSTAAAYETSISKFNKQIYWIQTQAYNGLTLNQSAAFMAGYIAGMEENKSLTNKVITGVNSVNPAYTTETGTIGAKLLELSVPFLKVRNRVNNEYYCINSELPDGYDLYINRVRDAIIDATEAELLLGEQVTPTDENIATMIAEKIIKTFVKDKKYLEDIQYHIEKTETDTVKLVYDKLIFNEIIKHVKIEYEIEVQ